MEKITGLNCILLIDDDPATNFIHEKVIGKMQWDVHVQVTFNAMDALEYLEKNGVFSDSGHFPQPGIIFLDINMPGMNGWEFLEVYKNLPKAQQARIVIAMLTTSLNPDDEKRAKNYKEEVKEFLHKPLTPKNLNDLVEKYY
jgi:CheY-like chemotaxis protein